MKIKDSVKTLQQGGEVSGTGMVFGHTYTPFNVRQQTNPSQDDQKESKKSNSKKNDLVDEDLLKSLVGKGITSDVNANIQGIVSLQLQYDRLNDVDKNSNEGMMLLNKIQVQSAQVNSLLRNAELFKTQQQNVVSKDALNEIAVTSAGVMIQDSKTGKIGQVSPEQLASASKEDLAGIRILTNAELINEREYNIQLQNDTRSFEQLNNSVGFMEIKKQVKEMATQIAYNKTSETRDAYTDSTGQLQEGLKQLKNLGDTPIDNIISTISSQSNDSQLLQALDAIWSTLGDNAKIFLKQRAIMQGQKGDNLEMTAKSYIAKLLSPKSSNIKDSDIVTDLGAAAKAGGTKSGSLDEHEKTPMGYWDTVQNDTQPLEMMPLQPNGGSYAFDVPTRTYGAMRNKDGTIYQSTSIGEIPELGAIAVTAAASFGGESIVPKTSQMAIAYNGDPLYRRTMPYKIDPKSKAPIPDFDMLVNYEQQIKEITALKNQGKEISISQRQKIFKSNGLNSLDAQGNPTNIQEFYQTPVYLGEEIYDELDAKTQSFLTEVDEKGASRILELAFEKSTTQSKKNKPFWSKNDDVYTGIIYYPQRIQAGVQAGAIEDKDIKLGELNSRRSTYQTRTGQINQSVMKPQNIDLLNTMYQ